MLRHCVKRSGTVAINRSVSPIFYCFPAVVNELCYVLLLQIGVLATAYSLPHILPRQWSLQIRRHWLIRVTGARSSFRRLPFIHLRMQFRAVRSTLAVKSSQQWSSALPLVIFISCYRHNAFITVPFTWVCSKRYECGILSCLSNRFRMCATP